MNSSDYKFFVGVAHKVEDDDFRIEDNLGEPRLYGLAHLLSEMARSSKYGLEGAAFRHWVAGVYRDGVYVHADNYRIGVSFASYPDAKPILGCRHSCAHGNPWPQIPDGRWIAIRLIGTNRIDTQIDQAVRTRVLTIANDIVQDAVKGILRQGVAIELELKKRQQEREQEEAMVVKAWT